MVPSARRAAFIEEHTRLRPVPGVPEVHLHLADDVTDVWEDAQEAAGGDAPLPFWAAAWPGGIGLARYVLDHADVVAGRCVWDVATGSGVVAVAAARAGAAEVVAADVDPDALVAVARNAAANRVRVRTWCGDVFAASGGGRDGWDCRGGQDVCDGRDVSAVDVSAVGGAAAVPASWLPGPDGRPPVVLLADVCYDADIAGRTATFVSRVAAAGADVLLGDPGRRHLPVAALRRVATCEVPGMAALEASSTVTVGVWAPR